MSGTASRPVSSAGNASSAWCSRPSRRAATSSSRARRAPASPPCCGRSPREWGIPLVFVEGNADLTPAKLVGHHNPARVLREDYSPDNFVDGPLVEAMRARRLPLHRGVQPRARGHAQHPADRHGRAAHRGAPGRRGGREGHLPGDRVDEPLRQHRHHPAVHVRARPALPPRGHLPGRGGRARHRRAARPAA